MQAVVEHIFYWCIRNRKLCWPVWLPRTHALIQEADRRSRLRVPHDDKSPTSVVVAANRMAWSLWRRPLSFDRAASNLTAISVSGRRLPFNSYYEQPGSNGVDMFMQRHSWPEHINYVYPPLPTLGRLITFLPSTAARSIVVFPSPAPVEWWSYAVRPDSVGVKRSIVVSGFHVVAFDFSRHGMAKSANNLY